MRTVKIRSRPGTYRVLRALSRALLALQMRLTVEYPERVPASGAVLLVSNHLGPTDPLPIGVLLERELRMLAKAEIFEWPVLGWLARLGGVVPIRRGESDREALRVVLRLLDEGQAVLVFPEGTYTHAPQPAAMLPVKTGAAWLAMKTGATVVPVGLTGSERVWKPGRGWWIWQRPRVHVVFGEPYQLAAASRSVSKPALDAAAEDMAQRIAALLPFEYRGVYGVVNRDGVLAQRSAP